MGQSSCFFREKKQVKDNNTITISSSTESSQPGRLSRFSEAQKNVLEHLSFFQPKKNALPVALTHLLQDSCQGLMRSLPLLLEVNTVYAKKGDNSHYFDPGQLHARFGLIEHVSSGKQFLASELSQAFEIELNHFDKIKVISKEAKHWSLILIFKIGKQTHSFSLKKLNSLEYVLHSLYEVTEEQMRDQEQDQQQKRKKNENIIIIPQSIKTIKNNKTDFDDKSIKLETQQLDQNFLYPEETTTTYLTQQDDIELLDESKQSTLPTTFNQSKCQFSLGLRDMTFKCYNCGEICFSPFSMLLSYLNHVADDLLLPLKSSSEPNPKGFMQLIGFTKTKKEQNKGYFNLFNAQQQL